MLRSLPHLFIIICCDIIPHMIKKIIIKIYKFTKPLLIFGLISAFLAVSINIYIVQYSNQHIVERSTYSGESVDCVIVLGASARSGSPSLMLRDRLDLAYELYENGYAKKILVSGDHMFDGYDEANAMKDYLMELGVNEQDIFMDHAGVNTYTTMKRAKEVFLVKSCIISTQEYHLYRAVYIAEILGIKSTGIACDVFISSRLPYFKAREFAARCKDFVYVNMLKPDVLLGEEIPIQGDGRKTEDGLT